MAKKFFYVCAGVLMLAGAFALGAGSVGAQVGDRDVVGISYVGSGSCLAITAGGDVYYGNYESENWMYKANIFVPKSKK